MDIGAISILVFIMSKVADSDMKRTTPVTTVTSDEGNPNAFTFTVDESEGSLAGTWLVSLSRVGQDPQTSNLTIESMEAERD